MIKNLIANIYFFYFKHFPIERGKVFLAKILNKLFGTFLFKHIDGFYLEIFLNSQMDLSYFQIGLKNPDLILNEIKKLTSGSKFIDIGANIGFYSISASKFVGTNGRIYSFEPSVREYSRLLTNISINKCNNIIPYNLALSDKSAEVILSTAKGHTGLNSLSSEAYFDVHSYQLVQGIPLDSLFTVGNSYFDLIKIDVEGAEYFVLQGMKNLLSQRRVKKIVIEITPKFFKNFGYDKITLYHYLESFNFKPLIISEEWQYDEIFILEN